MPCEKITREHRFKKEKENRIRTRREHEESMKKIGSEEGVNTG